MSDQNREGQGFRSIGSLAARQVGLQKPSDSTPGEQPTSSETTGMPSPVPAESSSIGRQPGGTGVAVRPRITPEKAMALCDPEEVDRLIVQSLEPPLASACQPVYREWIDPQYGYDSEIVAYRFDYAQADRIARDAARDYIRRMLAPADERTIMRELVRLRVSTKTRAEAEGDMALGMQVYAEECATYPADVVVWALRQWARTETFYPSLAELRDLLQRGSRRRESLYNAL